MAVQRRCFSRKHLSRKNRAHARFPVRVLTGPVNIGITKDGVSQFVHARKKHDILFHTKLTGTVRTLRFGQAAFLRGEMFRRTINGAPRRRENKLLDFILYGQFQQVNPAPDINFCVIHRIFNAFTNVNLCSVVVHNVNGVRIKDFIQLTRTDIEVVENGRRIQKVRVS